MRRGAGTRGGGNVTFQSQAIYIHDISVVTVAGICNSVGGGVFLTCNRGGNARGEYASLSRLELLIGNGCRRFKIVQLSRNALTAHCMRRWRVH